MAVGRKLALSLCILAALLGGAELAARLLGLGPPDPLQRHDEIVRVLGLPELNALLEPDPDCFWRPIERADRLPVRGTIDGAPIDFAVSLREHRRVVPQPAAPAGAIRRRVLMLGDSCTFGVGVEDGETLPARLAHGLAERGLAVEAVNAGVPGYSAWQGLRWLETRGEEAAPDAVVAIFGFNDFDRWGSLSDLEQARRRSGRSWRALLGKSRLARALASLGPKPPERPRLSAEEFALTLYGIARWCGERELPLVLGIWPYREQIEQRVPQHVAYQGVVLRVAHDQELSSVDLLPVFLGAAAPLYLDHVHANRAGCALAAAALEEPVARALERRSPR